MSLVHPPLHSVHLNALRPTPPARDPYACLVMATIPPPLSSVPVPSLNSQPSTLNCGVGASAPRRP